MRSNGRNALFLLYPNHMNNHTLVLHSLSGIILILFLACIWIYSSLSVHGDMRADRKDFSQEEHERRIEKSRKGYLVPIIGFSIELILCIAYYGFLIFCLPLPKLWWHIPGILLVGACMLGSVLFLRISYETRSK